MTTLKLVGKLEAMEENWSPEEWANSRRLVHFTKSRSGPVVTASFRPVSATESHKLPRGTCVSCIWWAERGEACVTSVDVLSLLELLLVAPARLSVERKNRIRRGLEGYRPITISKSDAEHKDFFSMIMGFPAPKPRNIEKDIKVFEWKILERALKSITSKYTSGSQPPWQDQHASQVASSATAEATVANLLGNPLGIPVASMHSTDMLKGTKRLTVDKDDRDGRDGLLDAAEWGRLVQAINNDSLTRDTVLSSIPPASRGGKIIKNGKNGKIPSSRDSSEQRIRRLATENPARQPQPDSSLFTTVRHDELDSGSSAFSITDEGSSTDDESPESMNRQKRAMLIRLMQYFHSVWAASRVATLTLRTHTLGASACSRAGSGVSQPTAQTTSPDPSRSSRTTPPCFGKRPFKDEEDDRKGTKRPRAVARNTPKEDMPQKFACPFFKKNPSRYRGQQTCPGPGWPTVHRAKEHVYRRHALPISCPRCHETFATDRLKDQHIDSARRCDSREQTPAEGMDATQKELLRSRKKTHKAMSEAEKWHEMYLVLFPDTNPLDVPSPYYEYATEGGALSSSDSEIARYERFLQQQMPAQVRQELETRIEGRLRPLEESLRQELVGIVADVQVRLFEMYRAMLAAGRVTDEAPSASLPSTSPEAVLVEGGDCSTGKEPPPLMASAVEPMFGFDDQEFGEMGEFDGMLFDFSDLDYETTWAGFEADMPSPE